MQQASAKSYFAHFKDKKQKSSFRGEREREITPKIPCKLFLFETISALSPSSSLTCWISKPRCPQECIPWYSHVLCHVQPEEMPCCRRTGILQDQLHCKAMHQVHCRDSRESEGCFISAQRKPHGLKLLPGPWRSGNSVLTKSATADWQLWACTSRVPVFSNMQFLLSLAQRWAEEWDLEDRKEPDSNKNHSP